MQFLNSPDHSNWRTVATVFAGILLVCGVGLCIHGVRAIERAIEIRSWPRIQADVLKSEVRATIGRGRFSHTTHVPWVDYVYNWKGRQVVASGPVPTHFGWSERVADDYVRGRWIGSIIHVSVDPDRGEPSFIEVDRLDGYVALAIGAGLVVTSLCIIWSSRRTCSKT